jgi:hypothetical protein
MREIKLIKLLIKTLQIIFALMILFNWFSIYTSFSHENNNIEQCILSGIFIALFCLLYFIYGKLYKEACVLEKRIKDYENNQG